MNYPLPIAVSKLPTFPSPESPIQWWDALTSDTNPQQQVAPLSLSSLGPGVGHQHLGNSVHASIPLYELNKSHCWQEHHSNPKRCKTVKPRFGHGTRAACFKDCVSSLASSALMDCLSLSTKWIDTWKFDLGNHPSAMIKALKFSCGKSEFSFSWLKIEIAEKNTYQSVSNPFCFWKVWKAKNHPHS